MNKKVLVGISCAIILTGLVGCGENKNNTGKTIVEKPVEIHYTTYKVGTSVASKAETKKLERFNELYGDKIKLIVEEVPSDDSYIKKMKTLAASNALPDVLDGKQGLVEIAKKNGQIVELSEVFSNDEKFKNEIGEAAIKSNTVDGKIYSIPVSRQIIGYYYNSEIFDKAGIKPAKTWDEFFANCDKIKELGIAPVALMTGENAWTTNLMLGARVASINEAGEKLMNTLYPKTYQTPEFIEGLDTMRRLLVDYTTPDAIGAIYANAANNFCQGKAAIIANGPWMISDFSDPEKSPEGFDKKVKVAAFPEDTIISDFSVGMMLCTDGKSDKIKNAAIDFLKFYTGAESQKICLEMAKTFPLTASIDISEDFLEKNPLVKQHIELSDKAKHTFKTIQKNAYAGVAAAFAKEYPNIVYGESTVEEMAANLDKVAAKSK